MPLPPDFDRLVLRAQRGDRQALDAVCRRARPMLVRHARRLIGPSGDVEDAVQEVLIVVSRRIGSYRWEGSFAGWLYATATRTMLRTAARSPRDAALAVELAEEALLSDHEPMTDGEWRLIEHELHLACTIAVLDELSPETRRAYLLGEVITVPDRVGAEVMGTTPAAYRKRLERARRQVIAATRAASDAPAVDATVRRAAAELDGLVRLGELHRARGRPAQPDGAMRALERIAPTLAA